MKIYVFLFLFISMGSYAQEFYEEYLQDDVSPEAFEYPVAYIQEQTNFGYPYSETQEDYEMLEEDISEFEADYNY